MSDDLRRELKNIADDLKRELRNYSEDRRKSSHYITGRVKELTFWVAFFGSSTVTTLLYIAYTISKK
jgi:hypothetical protein